MQSALYREPVLLDSQAHRHKRIGQLTDFSNTAALHAVYLTGEEFTRAALDFAIVFVKAGDLDASGKPIISPVVMLGLAQGENLYVEGTRWDARYLPAFIRRYPFLTASLKGTDMPGVLIDQAWSGFSDTEGEPLFDAGGQHATALTHAIKFLEMFDAEAKRTTAFCASLRELDILQPMTADATLPGGVKLSVDGFLTVNETKLRALSDSTIVGLHRSGMLMLLHAHLMSLSNIRSLVDRKAKRMQAAAPSPAVTAETAPASTPSELG